MNFMYEHHRFQKSKCKLFAAFSNSEPKNLLWPITENKDNQISQSQHRKQLHLVGELRGKTPASKDRCKAFDWRIMCSAQNLTTTNANEAEKSCRS